MVVFIITVIIIFVIVIIVSSFSMLLTFISPVFIEYFQILNIRRIRTLFIVQVGDKDTETMSVSLL